SQGFAIPIPAGVSPMDWQEWGRLRDAAFEWTSAELETRGLAQREDSEAFQGASSWRGYDRLINQTGFV
ncbi:MAG: hypothetical protein WB610_00005, partial [Rhodomicrobium sp.]